MDYNIDVLRKNEEKIIAEFEDSNEPAGLYLHIPFCEGKCRYCDFYSENFTDPKMEEFLSSLKREMSIYSQINDIDVYPRSHISGDIYHHIKKVDTVYIGGGTPGLLSAEQLNDLLKTIKEKFSISKDAEITIEANPFSLSEEKISAYREAGVNRLSLGVQSFNDNELSFLGRKHTSRKAEEKIELVKKYFRNFNIDLIFAIPGQNLADWENTLKKAISFAPPHISLYNLQIEEGTPMAESLAAGEFQEVDDSLDAEMYLLARNKLGVLGYQQYEVSNFSLPGYQSKHNRIYWRYKPYLGFGPAAHGFTGRLRYNNYPDIATYNSILQESRINNRKTTNGILKKTVNYNLPIENIIDLNKEDQMAEFIFMGLRLLEGISLDEFYNKYKVKLEEYYSTEIEKLKHLGLIEITARVMKLTEKGLLHGNSVFMEFLPV